MKRYRVTGLNKQGRCDYRNEFEDIEEAERWYNKVMQRVAIKFVLLYDKEEQKHIKTQGC